jgi:hypothetical protein
MERIQALINHLQEQVQQQADATQMQATLQLIQAELSQLQSGQKKILGTSKVAVMMPAAPAAMAAGAAPAVESGPANYSYPKVKTKSKPQLDLHFDPLQDIPTLSHQKQSKEINEAVEQPESLNDKLRENKTELMQVLKDSPIRDLRKAIGINDRFLFINELFRGDEAMYERSIKTINSFNIFPEAEYWMTRELQIKLGWDESKDIVQHFYQLVKRRFASM